MRHLLLDFSRQALKGLIADVDLAVLHFDDFGKGVMKKAGVSPDAWAQMALQLAYGYIV